MMSADKSGKSAKRPFGRAGRFLFLRNPVTSKSKLDTFNEISKSKLDDSHKTPNRLNIRGIIRVMPVIMGKQLYHRLSLVQVKDIFSRYHREEITTAEAVAYLRIDRSQFYTLWSRWKEDPDSFSITPVRTSSGNTISPLAEERILAELKIEKEKIIDNPDVPTKRYNYSYVHSLLKEKHGTAPSVGTIINRAKKHGYWKENVPKKKHERVVLTNYVGELIQHDSSHHLFAPDAKVKWYLITSLDDYSRALLYADLWEHETTWAHIEALQSLVLTYGIPFSYYVDQHRIFRYVKNRDKESLWVTYTKFTDDVDPQWKQVVKSIGSDVIYALSPQAKGKIERPYQWLQDHLVRTCVREGVTTIERAREILRKEVDAYNTKLVHSTTGEIPNARYQTAVLTNRSLFRPFVVVPPHQLAKDVFCMKIIRRANGYRQVSLGGMILTVPEVERGQEVELRLVPNLQSGMVEIRFWVGDKYLGSQTVRSADLTIVRF